MERVGDRPAVVACGFVLRTVQYGVHRGHAQDPTGKPVLAASVVIQNTYLSSKRITTTDAHGDFRMSDLFPGALTVEAKGQGLSTRRPVRVTLGLGSALQWRADGADRMTEHSFCRRRL